MAKKPTKQRAMKTTAGRANVKRWTASIIAGARHIDKDFVTKAEQLGRLLKKDVWFLVHTDVSVWKHIDLPLLGKFVKSKHALPAPVLMPNGSKRSRLAVMVDSPGGYAEPAYRIASLLRRRSGGFTAVVPRYAKSAATLFALGAEKILLGEDAELGPLDAQFFDFDIEEDWVSALDEVQAVEALEQSAIDSAWRIMLYLRDQTGKRLNTLMPHALTFAAELTKPLFDKIDAVRYSRQSRRLQEAQDYAERLLQPQYSPAAAKAIARDLVRNYPTHAFVVDRLESVRVGRRQECPTGLKVEQDYSEELESLLDWFYENLPGKTIIGNIVEE
jgi:hypothetical protein